MADKSKNSHIERTVYVSPAVTPGSSLRWGAWSDKPSDWREHTEPMTIIELATGSDYSGSLVERSNFRVLQRDFPWLVELYGGHGTQGLAYLGKRENQNPALIEAIDSLTDYPILDDSDHSELECETEDEAWEAGGRDDFKRALVEYFNAQYAPDEHDLDGIPDERIDSLWHACTERLCGGESFVNEQGDSIYFPIDNVIQKIERCWPGLSKNGYDGSPSIDWMLVRLAEDCTVSADAEHGVES